MAPGGERETDFAADECLFDFQTFDFQTFDFQTFRLFIAGRRVNRKGAEEDAGKDGGFGVWGLGAFGIMGLGKVDRGLLQAGLGYFPAACWQWEQAEAIAKVEALVLRVLADGLDRGERAPELEKVFTVAA
jgi:hypothetical protein